MITSINIKKHEKEAVETLTKKLGMSQSQVIRLAIILLAAKEEIAIRTEVDDPIEMYLIEKG